MSEPTREEIEKGFKEAVLVEIKKAEDPLGLLVKMEADVEEVLRKMANCNLVASDELLQDYKTQLKVIKLLLLRDEKDLKG